MKVPPRVAETLTKPPPPRRSGLLKQPAGIPAGRFDPGMGRRRSAWTVFTQLGATRGWMKVVYGETDGSHMKGNNPEPLFEQHREPGGTDISGLFRLNVADDAS